jgi:hypothetical protein
MCPKGGEYALERESVTIPMPMNTNETIRVETRKYAIESWESDSSKRVEVYICSDPDKYDSIGMVKIMFC